MTIRSGLGEGPKQKDARFGKAHWQEINRNSEELVGAWEGPIAYPEQEITNLACILA